MDSTSLGSVKRRDNFKADNSLPKTWYAINEDSYKGSDFDRGHNYPSGDRTSFEEANSSTFLMTNMIPQAPENNQQTWERLEDYTRSLVRDGKNEAYIIMGSYGSSGTGRNGYLSAINTNGVQINVPSHVWKVVVIIPNGSDDLNRINTNTRVIAVDTPNENSINRDWKIYRTSVHAIEMTTGYNLLTNLPPPVRITLQSKVDNL